MIFLGLPLNQISAEEVAETVANFSIHHKQDNLGKLLLTWEYIFIASLLLSVNFLISHSRTECSRKGRFATSSLEKYFCFLLIYFQQVCFLVVSWRPEIMLKSHNLHLLLKLTSQRSIYKQNVCKVLFTVLKRWTGDRDFKKDKRGCIIQGDESCRMSSRQTFLGFPQTQNWPAIFIAFQGHLSQQTQGPIKEVNTDAWWMRTCRCSRNLLPEDWMNQQQSRLLQRKGANEQEAKDVDVHDMEEIQATSVPILTAIVAAATGQFKAQIMPVLADTVLDWKSV